MGKKYEMIGEWNFASNGYFGFCRYGGKVMFIKKPHKPKYPARKSDYLIDTYKLLMKQAEEYEKDRNRLFKDLRDCEKKCPSIVAPKDFFHEDDSFIIISDKIDCSRQIADADVKRLPQKDILNIMLQLAEGIAVMTEKGIVHGDLKPSNVFIIRESTGYMVKIIDFDDSYYSENPPEPEATVGSPEYYSPELGEYIAYEDPDRKGIVTCKSDVFAMGVMFHTYLTGTKITNNVGKYPFQIDREEDLEINPSIKNDMRDLIQAMLRMDRDERISASEVVSILRSMLHGEKISVPGGKIRGPALIPRPDGTYEYIDENGKSTIVDEKKATFLAKLKGVKIAEEGKEGKEAAKPSTPGLPKGPALVPQSDGNYLYVDARGKPSIVDPKTAEMLAKMNSLPFGGRPSEKKEEGEGKASTSTYGPKLILQSDGNYLYLVGDGSRRLVDKKTAQMLAKIKGIDLPE